MQNILLNQRGGEVLLRLGLVFINGQVTIQWVRIVIRLGPSISPMGILNSTLADMIPIASCPPIC